jgi:CubicO group peptidase (beta-lactamase class C family)
MARMRRTTGAAMVVLAVALVACSGAGGRASDPPVTSGASTSTSAVTPSTTVASFDPPDGVVPIDYPSQPADVPWPTDEWPEGPLPPDVDPAAVDAVLDRAFGELSPSEIQATDAVVVVQGGRIVAERYREGFGDAATIHRSWSMAKSFTQALVGILVAQGRLDIEAPAPVPEWEDPDDPRHAITTDQLLRMASGLAWKEDYFAADSDTVAMLGGAGQADMAHYAADKPLEVEPGTRVRYATGTSNILAGVVGRIVGSGDPYEAFIAEELLLPLGIDPAHTNLGWDGAGNLIGGSVFDLTARDFARFGLLYARGGVWDGESVVPPGWVDYARTPTPPPAGTDSYGAHWWTYDDCPDGFRAGGLNGQHIVICPTLDLVVVVLSNRVDGRDGEVRDGLVHVFRDAAG